jgi:hypothetical protein
MEPVSKMEALTDRLHGGQKRQDGTTNAMHVRRVRTFALRALEESGEKELLKNIAGFECAALGHDLLEDTPATEAEIRELAGEESLRWIKELTNTWGDDHPAPYVEQVKNASEEARLIKYADLCDNTFQASYSSRGLGKEWLTNFFLPIIDPMSKALSGTSFPTYPKTASLLRSAYALARAHLEESISQLA